MIYDLCGCPGRGGCVCKARIAAGLCRVQTRWSRTAPEWSCLNGATQKWCTSRGEDLTSEISSSATSPRILLAVLLTSGKHKETSDWPRAIRSCRSPVCHRSKGRALPRYRLDGGGCTWPWANDTMVPRWTIFIVQHQYRGVCIRLFPEDEHTQRGSPQHRHDEASTSTACSRHWASCSGTSTWELPATIQLSDVQMTSLHGQIHPQGFRSEKRMSKLKLIVQSSTVVMFSVRITRRFPLQFIDSSNSRSFPSLREYHLGHCTGRPVGVRKMIGGPQKKKKEKTWGNNKKQGIEESWCAWWNQLKHVSASWWISDTLWHSAFVQRASEDAIWASK